MKMLFVCTGNSCRSPMAETIARAIFEEKGLAIEVCSRGVSVLMALPPTDHAIAAVEAYGDLSTHRTRQLTKDDIDTSDIIVTMTARHKTYLEMQSPESAHKLFTLAEYAGIGSEDIVDPFGGDQAVYNKCAKEIYDMIEKISNRLKETPLSTDPAEEKKKIAIGCDHGGFELKNEIITWLTNQNIAYEDFGTNSTAATDYPIYARAVAKAILDGRCDKGILICGTGIGISIAANRIHGIRAALCHDVFSAKATRQHNDANILAMGGRVIGPGHAIEIVDMFLKTAFSGEQRHIDRINSIEGGTLHG